eukprot:GHVU01102654.1.p1 GENE.GHVU01102654.1~~GHVU01102654.1.p1  ORF type:complete len:202 (+),score=17.25 GHVU01102654.1:302-907(+)
MSTVMSFSVYTTSSIRLYRFRNRGTPTLPKRIAGESDMRAYPRKFMHFIAVMFMATAFSSSPDVAAFRMPPDRCFSSTSRSGIDGVDLWRDAMPPRSRGDPGGAAFVEANEAAAIEPHKSAGAEPDASAETPGAERGEKSLDRKRTSTGHDALVKSAFLLTVEKKSTGEKEMGRFRASARPGVSRVSSPSRIVDADEKPLR